jgi:hypothetical protein
MFREIWHAGDHIARNLCRICLREQVAGRFLVRWGSAGGAQPIRGEREITREGCAPRDIFNVLVEAAVFVDDQHCRQLALAIALAIALGLALTTALDFVPGPGHIGLHIPGHTFIGDVSGGELRVVFRNLLPVCIVRLDERQDGRRGGNAARDFHQPRHEFPARQRRVHVVVVEGDDARVELGHDTLCGRKFGGAEV